MASGRLFETTGFILIAAALHVSAAAIMIPDPTRQGDPLTAPAAQARLAAGSADLADLVAEWDAPPQPTPEAAALDAAPLPEPPAEAPIGTAMAPPPALATPAPLAMRPNLPPPPEPQREPQPRIPPDDLPPLHSFAPPVFEAAPPLRLEASARPEPRPARPEPGRDTRAREPQRPRAESPRDPAPQRRQAAAPAPRGQGGQAARSASGGAGGLSSSQRASLQARWQAQISACLLRSIARTSGGSGLRATLVVQVGRNGRVQAAQVTGSTGNARIDREIARGAGRARCAAAPAGLSEGSYAFTQPISIR
ncbi:hypothetical protein [Paracoccus spongiarum]|uniref:TonB family protein n=1 Tax=Paracoccus spongiarum TaxID=3064387 RepID=A0ABT9JFR9_9RHOB|nr:hypothetical protein [Paracoccus sp. 2205BS29-5]MDP5307937.1 hypothetical protein [Paracoccus sp. 2205BS29-5]